MSTDASPFQRVALLAGISDEVADLLAALQPVSYPAGAVLFHEGGVGDRLYIVLEGAVEIIKALGSPDERLLASVGAGDFTGEMSLLAPDGRRTASARVSEAAAVLELSRGDFDALLRREPAVSYELLRRVSARLRDAHDRAIRDLRDRNARLAQALADLQAAQERLVEQERFAHEMRLARDIQGAMLPGTMPRLPGVELAARMLPAREVAGDFFDAFALGPRSLGVVVGDVCGKGVPAALYMAQVRSLLRAEAPRADSPAEALRQVNRLLRDLAGEDLFVTLVYATLDLGSRALTVARAGHDQPLIWDSAGAQVRMPLGVGHPLGMLPDPSIDVQRLTLPPGASMLLFSDGATEASDSGGAQLGRAGLAAVSAAAWPAPPDGLCDALLEAVAAHRAPAPQEDDLTLLALRLTGD